MEAKFILIVPNIV